MYMGVRTRLFQPVRRGPVLLAVLMLCLYFGMWPLLTVFSTTFSSSAIFAGPPPWYFLAVGGLLVVYLGYQLSVGSVSRAENVVTAILVISLYLVVLPFASRHSPDFPAALLWYFLVAGLPLLTYVLYRKVWRPAAAKRRGRRE